MSIGVPQRAVIAAAWERARTSGLVPTDRPEPMLGDISAADPLLDAARPVLSRAAETLHGTPTALLLVDHQSRMVSRVSADSTLERRLTDVGVVSGAEFSESAMGTTALGTTAEVRGDVVINSHEHYLEQFRVLSCFGQPIIHPSTRRVAGILCMTQVAEQLNPLSVPLVRGIVSDIAERLLSRSHLDHRQVIATFERAAERRDIAVVAVGDDLQLTNTPAAQLLAPADFGTLRLFLSERDVPPVMTLVSGVVTAVEAVPIPGVRSSAIFRLRPRMGTVPATALTAGPRRGAAGAGTVAISGEPGTGRTTAAFTVVAREEAVLVDVPAALLDSSPVDLTSALRSARTLGRGVVVDGADLLDDRSLQLLQAAIAARTGADAPLVLVTGPTGTLSPLAAAVVARCRRRTTVPPLRQRLTELARLGQELLGARTPPVTLGADATDALVCQDWPGNLSEFAMVLSEAADTALTRGRHTVGVADLPADYRNNTRVSRLLGLEQAERLAIIEALDATDGNKSHAAKRLGISRTTLYARIRALGIG